MLKLQPAAQISLRRSGGGVFEIRVGDRLAFSKKATHRFPTDEEIRDCIA